MICLPNAQVDLYEGGTIAIVEAVSPELGNRVQRVRVQLPGTSSDLLNKFREKRVDFASHTNTEDGGAVFLNLLGERASCNQHSAHFEYALPASDIYTHMLTVLMIFAAAMMCVIATSMSASHQHGPAWCAPAL